MLDTGATCNIMCASEYEKMEHKPPLNPSNDDIFQWGTKCPVTNLGKFIDVLTYKQRLMQDEIHVLKGDVPVTGVYLAM